MSLDDLVDRFGRGPLIVGAVVLVGAIGTTAIIISRTRSAAPTPRRAPSTPEPPVAPPKDSAINDGPLENPFTWTTYSKNNKAVLSERIGAGGRCDLSCSIDDTEVWAETNAYCMGKRFDLRFVANDCGRVFILRPIPLTGPWMTLPVGVVFRHATRLWEIAATTVTKGPTNNTPWVKGVGDVPGEKPSYSDDGTAVTFESHDGIKNTISLIDDTPKAR